MKLQQHYDAMRAAALPRFAQGTVEVDTWLDSTQDNRRGITLLARPPAAITAEIEAVLADFRRAEPDQYYYPAADIHLTVLSIISCYRGFTLSLIDPGAYREAIRVVLQEAGPFSIRFAGLTASPGGIIVQGFPQDEGLQQLRDALRTFFRRSGLQHSIDQRYSIQTAHSTILRFRVPLRNPGALLKSMQAHEKHVFGTFEVDALELVYNDWYQRAATTVLLEKYRLD